MEGHDDFDRTEDVATETVYCVLFSTAALGAPFNSHFFTRDGSNFCVYHLCTVVFGFANLPNELFPRSFKSQLNYSWYPNVDFANTHFATQDTQP